MHVKQMFAHYCHHGFCENPKKNRCSWCMSVRSGPVQYIRCTVAALLGHHALHAGPDNTQIVVATVVPVLRCVSVLLSMLHSFHTDE